MTRVLFVCLGNIYRSPTAEGVFRALVRAKGLEELIEIDSAGTGAWHIGHPPDPRAIARAARRGIDLSGLRARQVLAPEDFVRFDLLLAMDEDNLLTLQRMCPPHLANKLGLLMAYGSDPEVREVPDPYYGGEAGFERVLDLVEEACAGLLHHIRRESD